MEIFSCFPVLHGHAGVNGSPDLPYFWERKVRKSTTYSRIVTVGMIRIDHRLIRSTWSGHPFLLHPTDPGPAFLLGPQVCFLRLILISPRKFP